MIRVYRVDGTLTGIPERPAELEGRDVGAVERLLAGSGLTQPESAAVTRALIELRDQHGGADILVARGGALYRTFLRRTPVAAPPATPSNGTVPDPARGSRFTSRRGAKVTAVDTSATIARFGELLVFLGYDARTVVVEEPSLPALDRALEGDSSPLVVLGPGLEKLEPRGVAGAPGGPRRRFVALTEGRQAPSGVDAVIALPVASDRVAPTLDALIEPPG